MPKTVDDAVRTVCGAGCIERSMRFMTLGQEVAEHPVVLNMARQYAELFLVSTRSGNGTENRCHLEGVLLAALMSGVQIGVEMEKQETLA